MGKYDLDICCWQLKYNFGTILKLKSKLLYNQKGFIHAARNLRNDVHRKDNFKDWHYQSPPPPPLPVTSHNLLYNLPFRAIIHFIGNGLNLKRKYEWKEMLCEAIYEKARGQSF